MKEKLQNRFDALQDRIIATYEQADDTLTCCVRYWYLQRQEAAIYYVAQENGIVRLGLQRVPPKSVSEAKAKKAILMTMLLEGLMDSPYGSEKWTLSATSAEMLATAPKGCFKKGGRDIRVVFDKDSDNSMVYTCWNYIYKRDANDQWHKHLGYVNEEGLFYRDSSGTEICYVSFCNEANKYGQLGVWEVIDPNVDSASDSESRSTDSRKRKRYLEPRASSPPKAAKRLPSSSSTPPVDRLSGPPPPPPPPALPSPEGDHLRQLRRAGGGGGGGERGPLHERTNGPCGQTAAAAKEVGGRPCDPEKQPELGSGGLHQQPVTVPVLIVKGSSNILKCWRNRTKSRWPSCDMSTAWTWTGMSDGGARMLVRFQSSHQREQFLRCTKPPKGTEMRVFDMPDF